ncbi:efflux RND transporter permease subunit [Alkalitalea saponilacus]|uniref:Cu(I)/Ag(I) efflux system membrane protein CusA/SilA n=1 Tax=Alkalitalea saponilacus TaxID=889453 RepID=A0A1T5CM38_9BACT|nr:efflux RND transporter permease subunit [Alkalitalea saponilacus]ASB49916.1 cation transporter [Alkalitalea saponilacus]SKB60542.1 Cu(I)/Ag(I) efflux system membrane protein CusA/SilA [Alkalitalea saponilacus]
MLNRIIKFFLENKLVTFLLFILFVGWGIITAPFNWDTGFLPRDPVPVDAIPDIGENQQIIFTEWMGRSPEDIEDQITYPLTSALLGLPGVTSIRSTSMYGFSSIYVIFDDNVEYYWSRTRLLEKLNALPPGLLPSDVAPTLGPDATALGQIFWYTLEGRDPDGNPAGGWDLHELRSIQDFYVRNALMSAQGVSEVASVGGHVKEYQVDLDPVAMKAHGVNVKEAVEAIRQSNQDVGAGTVELNLVEYYVRGLGYVKSLNDIEESVVKVNNNIPIRVRDIAKVSIGPAPRAHGGVLDKGGAEATGGVVVARYGENPLKVIENVKDKIDEISDGLPTRKLDDGTISKVTIVPFYDRTELIYETLGTLYEAISLQILITIIVIIVMVLNLRASIMISALLPLAVLMSFIMMRYVGVDANIVALSGIAIAIGTMVDLGIILSENVIRHKDEASENKPLVKVVFEASVEVAPAILTAVSTTIVSFLPVFTLQQAEGKLFGPLAYTKTFALIAALIITFTMLPALAHWLLSIKSKRNNIRLWLNGLAIFTGVIVVWWYPWAGVVLLLLGIVNTIKILVENGIVQRTKIINLLSKHHDILIIGIISLAVAWLLAGEWIPLGVRNSHTTNFLFVVLIISSVLGLFKVFIFYYPKILDWCLSHKKIFLAVPAIFILLGINIWMGFDSVFGFIPKITEKVGCKIRTNKVWSTLHHAFPGMGKEFMPSLDEGAFLLMPTSMPHSGVDANIEYLRQLDMRVEAIPEVETVVGKAGRAESALDPAPMSMFENVILYRSEYVTDENGYPVRFKVDRKGRFELSAKVRSSSLSALTEQDNTKPVLFDYGTGGILSSQGDTLIREISFTEVIPHLIQHRRGHFFRQWREHINTPDDIWHEIVMATNDIPGVTSAPKLQPIETRLVMLQTGMRAPMGVKVFGPDLETIEAFSMKIEDALKQVPSVKSQAVFADRSLGKPYMEIVPDRNLLARYGISIGEFQHYVETMIGGMALTTTVEGRERYDIRVRYAREWRDDYEKMKRILLPAHNGTLIPLEELAEITYRSGPAMIRGENTFLVGFVLFDRESGYAEGSVVNDAKQHLRNLIGSGDLVVPEGVSYQFSGSYENQIRAEKRLSIIIPLVLVVIFLLLYFQFKSTITSFIIFSAIILAFSGGFMMLWLYAQEWFLDVGLLGTNLREWMQIRPYNLSVAVWVGFIALFGIATDDGVVITTYISQSFEKHKPENILEIRKAVMEAGMKRVRPCLMTTATTILALLPVLTSSGRGADIMIPMAIPAFGGMSIALVTLFLVPVLYSLKEEIKINRNDKIHS